MSPLTVVEHRGEPRLSRPFSPGTLMSEPASLRTAEMRIAHAALVVASSLMVLSLLLGTLRLMALNYMYTGLLTGLYGLHPVLMVFGFLAPVIAVERIPPKFLAPWAPLSAKLPPLAASSVIVGASLEVSGYSFLVPTLVYLGASLVSLSSGLFLAFIVLTLPASSIRLPSYYMMLSCIAWMATAVFSAFSLPGGDVPFVLLLLSFPVSFILGERVGLIWSGSSAGAKRGLRASLGLISGAVASFLVASFLPFYSQLTLLQAGLVLQSASFLMTFWAEMKAFPGGRRPMRGIRSYMRWHIKVSYVWGVVGLAIGIYFLSGDMTSHVYDALVHSISVGFVGTMLLAHGPVIIPSVLGRRFDGRSPSYLPLGLLTLANVIRVAGDVLVPVLKFEWLYTVIGSSGWLVLLAAASFVARLRKGSGEEPRSEPLR